jgi:HEAT repeat protein
VKLRFIFILLILGILGVLIVCTRAPRYHGRTLTSWLRQYEAAPLNETQRRQEAQDAVNAIGAKKALPRLLNLVEAKDDPVSLWLIARTGEFRIRFLRWRSSENYSFEDYERSQWHSAEDFQQLGIAGFEMLGTNAAPAVGELTKLLADKQHAFAAVRCLIAIGPPAELAVIQALTNQSVQVRYFATQQFGWVTDDTEDYLAYMKKCLNDPDGSVRFAAVQGIGQQTQSPDSAVPLLQEALRAKQEPAASSAAKFLADFGTNALRALPDLSNAVENGSSSTAYQALKTMVAIAPNEALPLVFKNFRSSDSHRRRLSVELLCKYPATNLEVQSVIQNAATDPDPALAKRAQELITGKYLAGHPFEPQFSDDPSYEGKRLDAWLKMRDSNGYLSHDATNAIQHMGTNAIPALLQRLVYVKPPFRLPAWEINMDAVRGFITLGEQAKPALPQLQALLDGTNQNLVLYAMVSALGTGTNAIPVLSKGLTNQFAEVRGEAARNLTEVIAIPFPERRHEIISLLTNLLNDPDDDVRLNATNQLKEIDPAVAKAGIK